ncbi:hypothetical protein BC628DRAFT_1418114 [Trametes gibbosa]|nr:hypothetical protein BC628DRAFT_1418114 [Trametes gibbosa]
MRAFDSVYEEPTFEEPSSKERSVLYAVVGAAVTIASTVAAIQITGPPEWLSPATNLLSASSRPFPTDEHPPEPESRSSK